MRTPPPLPSPFDVLPFHVREAADHGIPPARMRRGDLSAPFRGARSATPLVTIDDRCLSYLPLLREGHWFSHSTAARLWGMWLPGRLRAEPDVHVTAGWPRREPRMRGVVGHRVDLSSVTLAVIRGIPVASPGTSWCSLGTELSLDELVIAGDSIVRRRDPLGTLADLGAALDRHGRRRGASLLRRALPLIRTRSDSAREVALRLLLVRAGLPEPVVNLSIVDGEGQLFGDLGYPEWRVLVEYDGSHHLTSRQNAADILRLERLAAAEWAVVRVVKEHLDDPALVIRRVARALAAGGWRPPRSKLHLL